LGKASLALTGVGGLVPGLMALAAVVTGMAVILDAIGPEKKDDGKVHTNQHWEREANGRSGKWQDNVRTFGAYPRHPGILKKWVDDGDGKGHYDPVNPIAPAAKPMANVTVHTTLDRRGLSSMVAGDIAKASHQVLEGSAGTYDNGVLKPTIGMRGN
jgi:hypothetical protein